MARLSKPQQIRQILKRKPSATAASVAKELRKNGVSITEAYVQAQMDQVTGKKPPIRPRASSGTSKIELIRAEVAANESLGPTKIYERLAKRFPKISKAYVLSQSSQIRKEMGLSRSQKPAKAVKQASKPAPDRAKAKSHAAPDREAIMHASALLKACGNDLDRAKNTLEIVEEVANVLADS